MPGWQIAFLVTAPPEDTTSGLSRGIWELAKALAARGHAVDVLYPAPAGALPAVVAGVRAVPLAEPPPRRGPYARDIALGRAAAAALRPELDLVVGNDEKAGALEWRGARRSLFAMMVHDVGLHTFDTLRPLEPSKGLKQRLGDWLDRRTLERLDRAAFRRARLIVVGSELNRELLARHYGVSDARVVLVPHGVPDPDPSVSRASARLALRLPADVPVVAFIGRTPERQGLPIALEAFRRIRLLFPGARFLVVGCAPPAEPGVMPLGVVDEPTKAKALAAADLFLFPTRYEGFGLAPREAMRYGVAAIVSSHVPLDGIDPTTAVRIVASEDPATYASELAELIADPAMRRTIGAAGKAYADRFSFAAMAERFEGAVREAMGRPR